MRALQEVYVQHPEAVIYVRQRPGAAPEIPGMLLQWLLLGSGAGDPASHHAAKRLSQPLVPPIHKS